MGKDALAILRLYACSRGALKDQRFGTIRTRARSITGESLAKDMNSSAPELAVPVPLWRARRCQIRTNSKATLRRSRSTPTTPLPPLDITGLLRRRKRNSEEDSLHFPYQRRRCCKRWLAPFPYKVSGVGRSRTWHCPNRLEWKRAAGRRAEWIRLCDGHSNGTHSVRRQTGKLPRCPNRNQPISPLLRSARHAAESPRFHRHARIMAAATVPRIAVPTLQQKASRRPAPPTK